MITRQHTPGPWHDAVAYAFTYANRQTLPGPFADIYWREVFGLTVQEAQAISKWTNLKERSVPCPVAA